MIRTHIDSKKKKRKEKKRKKERKRHLELSFRSYNPLIECTKIVPLFTKNVKQKCSYQDT